MYIPDMIIGIVIGVVVSFIGFCIWAVSLAKSGK